MKKYKSKTYNRGTTVILDNLQEAIELGRKPKAGCLVYGLRYKVLTSYEQCVEAIVKGNPEIKEQTANLIDELRDTVAIISPSLACGAQGFERDVEGVTASPELLAAGEEKCCLRKKPESENIKEGTGDGAYRIAINTDVWFWGHPADEAALAGALVMTLKEFHPVEVWIQQGWLGSSESDGVTLFKLDFTGGFDPTALSFWISHEGKDAIFSRNINSALGRIGAGTSQTSELDFDMMVRGDLMQMAGFTKQTFEQKLHTEKIDMMAKWLAMTAKQIVFKNPEFEL